MLKSHRFLFRKNVMTCTNPLLVYLYHVKIVNKLRDTSMMSKEINLKTEDDKDFQFLVFHVSMEVCHKNM